MAARDEDALICDFAETYHILDYQAIPCRLAAKLAAGLPGGSRIRRSLLNLRVTPEVFLLATCADALRTLVWFQTKDGRKNINRPKSIRAALCGEREKTELRVYRSGADFDAARARILAEIENGAR